MNRNEKNNNLTGNLAIASRSRVSSGHHEICMSHQPTCINSLDSKGNYSATSNNTTLVHWPLMGGLLHLLQREGDWVGPQPAQVPACCTKCNTHQRPVYQSLNCYMTFCAETENFLRQRDDVAHQSTIYFALYKCTHCYAGLLECWSVALWF